MKPARVLIADDHDITGLGLRAILEPAGHFEFCGIVADGQAAVRHTRDLRPDLVVLDLGFLGLTDWKLRVRSSGTSRKHLLYFYRVRIRITYARSPTPWHQGLHLEVRPTMPFACGSRCSSSGPTLLYIPNESHDPEWYPSHGKSLLTPREREIVQLLVEGHCAKDVARMLCVSINTVDSHRTKIMRKLEVNWTARLILCAIRYEFVHLLMCAPDFRSSAYEVGP